MDESKRKTLIEQYKELQEVLRDLIIKEWTEKFEHKFQKIVSDNSRTTFGGKKGILTF